MNILLFEKFKSNVLSSLFSFLKQGENSGYAKQFINEFKTVLWHYDVEMSQLETSDVEYVNANKAASITDPNIIKFWFTGNEFTAISKIRPMIGDTDVDEKYVNELKKFKIEDASLKKANINNRPMVFKKNIFNVDDFIIMDLNIYGSIYTLFAQVLLTGSDRMRLKIIFNSTDMKSPRKKYSAISLWSLKEQNVISHDDYPSGVQSYCIIEIISISQSFGMIHQNSKHFHSNINIENLYVVYLKGKFEKKNDYLIDRQLLSIKKINDKRGDIDNALTYYKSKEVQQASDYAILLNIGNLDKYHKLSDKKYARIEQKGELPGDLKKKNIERYTKEIFKRIGMEIGGEELISPKRIIKKILGPRPFSRLIYIGLYDLSEFYGYITIILDPHSLKNTVENTYDAMINRWDNHGRSNVESVRNWTYVKREVKNTPLEPLFNEWEAIDNKLLKIIDNSIIESLDDLYIFNHKLRLLYKSYEYSKSVESRYYLKLDAIFEIDDYFAEVNNIKSLKVLNRFLDLVRQSEKLKESGELDIYMKDLKKLSRHIDKIF